MVQGCSMIAPDADPESRVIVEFSLWGATGGGAVIGASAVLLLAGIGRLAGVSGILHAALDRGEPRTWRIAFLVGLALGAAAFVALTGLPTPTPIGPGWGRFLAVVAGGILVGAGTRIAGGCTSGHGVCGLARGSARSFVAVLVFMVVAAGVVAATRHLLPVIP